MADEQIPPKDVLPNWKRFIRRPETGVALGVLGIAVTILLAWWFYPSVDPTYRAFPADTVARKESPRLTVAWDGVPIENLCVGRVALWNAGTQPITQDKLPTSDPLRIVPTHAVRILGVEIANSSRPTLTLDTQIVKSNEADHVQLSIHGGDAMEKGDGVAVRLLFTGDCKSDFRVEGRVIGSSGFRPVRAGGIFPVLVIESPTVLGVYLMGLFWNGRRSKVFPASISTKDRIVSIDNACVRCGFRGGRPIRLQMDCTLG
jgi:hypothetical protein